MDMKKYFGKFLCLIAAAAIFAGTFQFAAAADGADAIHGSFGDYDYELLDDGTVSVTYYRGHDSDVKLPNLIDGKPVTQIARGAFAACSAIKSVTIPDSVTKICSSAFAVCDSLEYVSIPDSVTEIEMDAFYLTKWIDSFEGDFLIAGKGILLKYKGDSPSVVISDNVRVIGCGALSDHTELKSVTIPDSVEIVDALAFYHTGLEKVTIPNSVTRIGESAFSRCSGLTSIFIPSTVKEIGESAFSLCDELTAQCRRGSAAEAYCKENNIPFEASEGEDLPPEKEEPKPTRTGDIDGDGEITSNDALMILRSSVGAFELTQSQKSAADTDSDREITSNDALKVLRFSIGAIISFDQ